ncbi:MAG TPA: hypothetical protein VF120_11520 [Ktedonobacterales bacterium]
MQQIVPAGANGGKGGGVLWGKDASDGCLIQIFTSGADGSATPGAGETWTILSRCGALIAGDSAAERAILQLPAANANEQAILARIRSQQ